MLEAMKWTSEISVLPLMRLQTHKVVNAWDDPTGHVACQGGSDCLGTQSKLGGHLRSAHRKAVARD